jgi:tetratricopeptide (TPR) repeat protein
VRRTFAVVVTSLAACLVLSWPALGQGSPHGGPPGPPPDGGRPEPPDRFPMALALRALDEKATILLEQGKTDAALVELKRAFDVDVPKDHPAYELKAQGIGRLAITLTNVGRKKEAIETIQRLLADVPPGSVAEAAAWLDAGTVYKQSGMPEEALKAFDRSIELAQKLAKTRGPAGRPPQQPPGGRPLRPQGQPPRGETP